MYLKVFWRFLILFAKLLIWGASFLNISALIACISAFKSKTAHLLQGRFLSLHRFCFYDSMILVQRLLTSSDSRSAPSATQLWPLGNLAASRFALVSLSGQRLTETAPAGQFRSYNFLLFPLSLVRTFYSHFVGLTWLLDKPISWASE